jgi:anaerobic dimethyl sulfoxide reductase subunit B (iron-sulfur subunit)
MKAKTQLGFYLNIGACIGCKACQTSCRDKNDLPDELNWRRVIEHTGGTWLAENEDLIPVGVFVYHLTLSCQHCKSPACLEVCPVSAISKADDGIVHVDQSKCVGCQSCIDACPYDTPQYSAETGEMSKCDMCADLRFLGQNPTCVDACPLRALDWGELSDLEERYGKITSVEPLPSGDLTGSSMVFTPHRLERP